MAIRSFEEIDAWKAARELTNQVYAVTALGPFAKDFGLKDQIQRASVSIMANIAEGFGSQSRQAFLTFLGYGLRSVTEVESHLYVALDQAYIFEAEFGTLYERATEAKRLIIGFMRYLRSNAGR